jgi:hypothetical protein
MKVNSGHDAQARMMGGDGAGIAVAAGTPTSTSFPTSGLTTGSFIGHLVVLGGVYGVITATATNLVTIDQWYTPGSPGGAAASAPAAGTAVILPGNAPLSYMALSDIPTGSPAAADTTLPQEITTAGGGLVRQFAAYAHTTAIPSYTLTGTFTVNGSDTGLPRTLTRIGVFNSLKNGQMGFEAGLPTSAVVSAVGDQLTVTQSVAN